MTITIRPEELDLKQFLRSGDSIAFVQACDEPTTLVEVLIAQGASIGGLSGFHRRAGSARTRKPEWSGR